MKDELTVSIPITFLLILAAYGNMGDGEIPKVMQIWAQKELVAAGKNDEMVKYQKERLRQLESNLRNILGDGPVDSILKDVKKAAQVLKNVLDQ